MALVIGDSMFAGGSSVVRHLSELAGHSLDNRAVVGAGFRRGWVKSIPEQYDQSGFRGNVILMDGGGNDVFSMINSCQVFAPDCRAMIDEINNSFRDLLNKMGLNGVEDVIFMGPYYVRESLRPVIDYGVETMGSTCASRSSTPRCSFVDTRNLTFPRGWDGIHPTEEGYQKLATAIWDTKLDRDIPL